MKVLIPELMYEGAVRVLAEKFETIYDPTLVDQPQKFERLLADADALIVRKNTQVTERLLSLAPKLRVVGRLGVGLDNIDVAACERRKIKVIPATNANAQSVAEHVIAAAMILLRPSFLSSAETARGDWPRLRHFSDRELAGKTLGLIGFGAIGQRTARLAGAFAMRLLAHDPAVPESAPAWRELSVRRSTLEEVLGAADIVSLHVPLLPNTRNLIDRARLAQMKRGAILINAARGGIVDEAALVEALKSGHLGGAHLDVFSAEPVGKGSIFKNVPNLLLTPHTAGVTVEAEMRIGELIADKVIEALEA